MKLHNFQIQARQWVTGSHAWLVAHPLGAWGAFAGAVLVTMFVEDVIISLGVPGGYTFLIAAPLLGVVGVTGYTVSSAWRFYLRGALALIIFMLLRWPTPSDLAHDAHLVMIGLLCLIGIGSVFFVLIRHTRGFGRTTTTSKANIHRAVSSHYTSSGTPKISYHHQSEAEAQALFLHRRDGAAMNAYRCGECSLWHVGHAK
jgi:hypothetical protein